MLMLTDAAAQVIGELTAQPSLPETSGLRIGPNPDNTNGPALSVSLTSGPGPQDEVIEVQRARVFVEPEVAGQLADKILDADTDSSGVAFHVRQQTAT